MASFYNVPVLWKGGAQTFGRGVRNNTAWQCLCGEIPLGPHEKLYSIDPCPGCGRRFCIFSGKKPQYF